MKVFSRSEYKGYELGVMRQDDEGQDKAHQNRDVYRASVVAE